MTLYKIPADGNCLFNAVLLASSNFIKEHSNPHVRAIITQMDLRQLVQDYLNDNFDKAKVFLKQAMIDSIKLGSFIGYSALTSKLQTIRTEYLSKDEEGEAETYLNAAVTDSLVRLYVSRLTRAEANPIWGGGLELQSISKILGIKILLSGQTEPIDHTGNPSAPMIEIQYVGRNHYNAFAVYPDAEIMTSIGAELIGGHDNFAELSSKTAKTLSLLDEVQFLHIVDVIFNKREAERLETSKVITDDEVRYAWSVLEKSKFILPKIDDDIAVGDKTVEYDKEGKDDNVVDHIAILPRSLPIALNGDIAGVVNIGSVLSEEWRMSVLHKNSVKYSVVIEKLQSNNVLLYKIENIGTDTKLADVLSITVHCKDINWAFRSKIFAIDPYVVNKLYVNSISITEVEASALLEGLQKPVSTTSF